MSRKILFVTGDGGSARILKPVYKKMINQCEITVLVDLNPKAQAGTVWHGSDIDFKSLDCGEVNNLGEIIDEHDIVVSGTCKTAHGLEVKAINIANDLGKTTVMASDAEFNYRYPQFYMSNPSYWMALNKAHQQGIMGLHKYSEERVPILGDPQLENLGKYIGQPEIRQELRKKLKAPNILITWWSPGDIERFYSAFAFVISGLQALKEVDDIGDIVFIPRLHPKMDILGSSNGNLDMFYGLVATAVTMLGIRLVRADQESLEELCLASDITLGCFTGATSIGVKLGRPVINLITLHEKKLAESMKLECPYFPEIEFDAAQGMFSPEEAREKFFLNALNIDFVRRQSRNSEIYFSFIEDASSRIADFLLSL